jgi:hypothetical protein
MQLAPYRTAHHTITVSERSKGKTVRLRVGDTLVVTLHSTYWQLDRPSDRHVLRVKHRPVASKGRRCPSTPGLGCGTVRATYLAVANGTAVVAAHLSTCGEALRCSPAEGSWRITARVG